MFIADVVTSIGRSVDRHSNDTRNNRECDRSLIGLTAHGLRCARLNPSSVLLLEIVVGVLLVLGVSLLGLQVE